MAVACSHAVKVLSPEMLSLWECAEVLFINAGHALRRVNGEWRRGARGRRPVRASHDVATVTREIHAALPRGVCLREPKRGAGQMAAWKSDRCVVPMKPGNAGGGKAATPSLRAKRRRRPYTGTQGRSPGEPPVGMRQGDEALAGGGGEPHA